MFGERGDFRGVIPRAVEHVFETLNASAESMEDVSISCSFLEIYNDSVRDLGKAYYVQKLQSEAGESGKDAFINEKTSDLFNNINRNRSNPYFAPAFAKKNLSLDENLDDVLKRPGLKQVMGEYQSMNLQIHEDSLGNVFVKDLTTIPLNFMEEALEVVSLGIKVRATHETKMNNVSSRSHTVFNLTVTHREKTTGELVVGMLNLVDLAGSERIKKSESQGPRLKEALHINSSLSALGKVVIALERGDHVPYRDSKLTRLLQNSLGGNSYTSLLTAIHPCASYYDECLSTLQFANRCLNVQNNPRVNYVGDEGIEDKDRKIRRLMEEINQLRVKLAQYERSGGGGGVLTGLALAEKMVSVLHKMGISASIGPDGSLRTSDGKTVSLNELNTLANVVPEQAEEDVTKREVLSGKERSPEQMRMLIEDLEKENDVLRQKNKFHKAKAEQVSKQLQELSDTFDRKKQEWQHQEYLLKRDANEADVRADGIKNKLDENHKILYKNLMDANEKIIETNLKAMNQIPASVKEMIADAQVAKKKNAESYILPLKEGYEKTLQNYKDAKDVEMNNIKEQYEYWLLEKDQALSKMLSGFNKYREKKSAQLRKCEQEIVTLFSYAEKLENVVKMAEEGRFYTQQSQNNESYVDSAGAGTTMIIPSSLKPTRPGTDKTKGPQLMLSQRIVKKSREHAANDERIKNDALEAMLLKHGGQNSADPNSKTKFVDSPEMTDQIRALINSPSVGRDLMSTAGTTAGSSRQKDKRDKLFSRDSGTDRRHTISTPSSKPRTSSAVVDTGCKTVRAHHSSAAGAGPKAATSIRNSVSINDQANSSFQPTDLEASLFRNPENIKYVFNDDDESNNNFGNSMPPSNFETMEVLPPQQTDSFSVSKSAQELDILRREMRKKEAEVKKLEADVADLTEQLNNKEQLDINQILESVEGNETLEYIRQLENEQLSLRNTIKDVSSQLHNAKVANAALSRQFQNYKNQMKKRPSSGRVITLKS